MTSPLYNKLHEDIGLYAQAVIHLDAYEALGLSDSSAEEELENKLTKIFSDVKNIISEKSSQSGESTRKKLIDDLLGSTKSLTISESSKKPLVATFLRALNLKSEGSFEDMLSVLARGSQPGQSREAPSKPQAPPRGQATPFAAAGSGNIPLRSTPRAPQPKQEGPPVPRRDDIPAPSRRAAQPPPSGEAPPLPPREDEKGETPSQPSAFKPEAPGAKVGGSLRESPVLRRIPQPAKGEQLPPVPPREEEPISQPSTLRRSPRAKAPPALPPREDEKGPGIKVGGSLRGRPGQSLAARPQETPPSQAAGAPTRTPGRLGKRDPSFLTKGKQVDRAGLADVAKTKFGSVADLREKLAAQFNKQVEKQVETFVRTLKKDVKSYAATVLTDIKGQEAVDEHVEKVLAKVENDLQAHLVKIDENTDEAVVDRIKGDINAYLKGVPEGMSIQEFLAYAFLYRCYESCLEMDRAKWEGISDGSMSSEEQRRSVQIETGLNYYELFHRNDRAIQSIEGFKDAGKRIRTLEAELTAQGKKNKYERARSNFVNYINNGNLNLALNRSFLGTSAGRIDPPKETPEWLTKALNQGK
ncbi:MAG: hypothetical protein CK425_03445 [Parachlamydia sp.]|nr:MAG: hypothetical protein CK425_03445 [Parachlamydia sp.]